MSCIKDFGPEFTGLVKSLAECGVAALLGGTWTYLQCSSLD